MVLWWTHRGFLALLFLVGVFGLFGALVTFTAGSDAFDKWPWLWGVGLLPAGAANWFGGCRLNRAPSNPLIGSLKDRLTNRARNKFLSLPMEVWSAPALLLGAGLIVKGLL